MNTAYGGAMGSALTRNWWLVLLRGVAAVVFGLLAFFWPHITLFALVLLFGIYAVVDGIISLANAFGGEKRGQTRVWYALIGVLGIVAGIVAFVWPGITALVLIYIIGAWAVLTGIAEIIAGIGLRHETSSAWLLVLGGVISVIFGVLVFVHPGAGAVAVVWLIGFYAIIKGVEGIAFAFRLRDWQQHPTTGGMPGMPGAAA